MSDRSLAALYRGLAANPAKVYVLRTRFPGGQPGKMYLVEYPSGELEYREDSTFARSYMAECIADGSWVLQPDFIVHHSKFERFTKLAMVAGLC
jgi:hypothetical protein